MIAGVTIGFLASAYKFVFAKAEPQKPIEQEQDKPEKATEN